MSSERKERPEWVSDVAFAAVVGIVAWQLSDSPIMGVLFFLLWLSL